MKKIFLFTMFIMATLLTGFSQGKTERLNEYVPANGNPLQLAYVYSYSQITGIPWNFIDISSTGTLLLSGDDEGTPVVLGHPFIFYGQEFSILAATTNGYLSTLTTDDGPDYTNNCPLPHYPSAGGGDRIYAYHDDLETSVYYQYFASCPIPNAHTGTTMGASVFQWVGNLYSGTDPLNVEAILYNNGDIAIYTSTTGGEFGAGATFGIQNALATEGLTLSCNNNLGTDHIAFFISSGATPVPLSKYVIFAVFGLLGILTFLRFKKIL